MLGLLALALVFQAPVAARAADTTRPPGRAVVTAITQGMVYVNAGRDDGLREGSLIEVKRLGPAGRYRVAYLSSKSSASRGDSSSILPAIGDSVTFTPVAATNVADGRTRSTGGGIVTSRRCGRGLRGRIGVRYIGFSDPESGLSLRQPGVELLMSGPIVPGAPVALDVDVRSRRTTTYRSGTDPRTEGLVGVYRAAVRFQSTRGSVRAVVGRQYAPVLAGLTLFDGALIDVRQERWGVGVMAGLAPELGTMAVSSEIRQLGGYFSVGSRTGAPLRWNLSAGAMGSYTEGEVNREFGFVQASISSRPVSLLVLQEVDVNRSWKLAAGEPRFSPTSTFATLSLNPSRSVSFNAGVDNRRNVRLYRDLLTPEDLFDDRFRLGVWGGMNLAIGSKLRLGGDVRMRTVATADSLRTMAYSGHLSVDRLTPVGIGLRTRVTRYETGDRGPGWLLAGAFRVSPPSLGGSALELSGGAREEQTSPASDRFWGGLTAELLVRRSWFGLVSYTREWGRDGLTPTTTQLYAGLSYRF
ncbi:MAG: hypothetical protein R2909_13775 [Gemmatimonadales bacterium]